MSEEDSAQSGGWPKVVQVIVALTVITSVLLIAFTLPNLSPEPHDLPIVLAGDDKLTEVIGQSLAQSQPDAFSITTAKDADAARQLLLDREAYAAFVFEGPSMTLLTASAASPVVAQMVTGAATGLAANIDLPVTKEDVRPLPNTDPLGRGLALGAFPLVIGGIVVAALMALLVQGIGRQVVGVFGFAIVGSLTLTAILQFWFGSLDGNYLLTSAAVALGMSATAYFVLGMNSVLGRLGIGIGAGITMLLGNPLSGLASAPELLPAGWGAFGQLLAPGAAGQLLRSAAFFDGAGAASSLMVLSFWVVLGLVLAFVGARRLSTPAT